MLLYLTRLVLFCVCEQNCYLSKCWNIFKCVKFNFSISIKKSKSTPTAHNSILVFMHDTASPVLELEAFIISRVGHKFQFKIFVSKNKITFLLSMKRTEGVWYYEQNYMTFDIEFGLSNFKSAVLKKKRFNKITEKMEFILWNSQCKISESHTHGLHC